MIILNNIDSSALRTWSLGSVNSGVVTCSTKHKRCDEVRWVFWFCPYSSWQAAVTNSQYYITTTFVCHYFLCTVNLLKLLFLLRVSFALVPLLLRNKELMKHFAQNGHNAALFFHLCLHSSFKLSQRSLIVIFGLVEKRIYQYQ